MAFASSLPAAHQKLQLKVNIEDSFRNSEAASEDDHIDLEWFSPEGNLLWTTFAKPQPYRPPCEP